MGIGEDYPEEHDELLISEDCQSRDKHRFESRTTDSKAVGDSWKRRSTHGASDVDSGVHGSD